MCGNLHDISEGLWMLKITNICVKKFLIFFLNFEKAWKSIIKSANFFVIVYIVLLLLLYFYCSEDDHKKSCTIKIEKEDGREAL